ncbi:MAG: VTT domain-containing protein [Candidatus Levybacteria bacterium]|nr:VTT domain-containing protein [Candidatus Levybacteria bacterium]
MRNKTYAGIIFFSSIALSIAFFVFRDYFKEASSLGLFGLFLVNFVSSATFFISAPAFLTVIAGGNLYSPILVAVIAATGACLGDMIGFLFGHSGRKLTKKKLDKHRVVRFLEKYFNRHGALIIFLFAIIPNPFFDAIGILAGVLNYHPLRFFAIMFVGRIIRYWALAQFGARL